MAGLAITEVLRMHEKNLVRKLKKFIEKMKMRMKTRILLQK